MSSCCNGPQKRKVKEWGTTEKESKPNNSLKLIISLAIIVAIGFIILQ